MSLAINSFEEKQDLIYHNTMTMKVLWIKVLMGWRKHFRAMSTR